MTEAWVPQSSQLGALFHSAGNPRALPVCQRSSPAALEQQDRPQQPPTVPLHTTVSLPLGCSSFLSPLPRFRPAPSAPGPYRILHRCCCRHCLHLVFPVGCSVRAPDRRRLLGGASQTCDPKTAQSENGLRALAVQNPIRHQRGCVGPS